MLLVRAEYYGAFEAPVDTGTPLQQPASQQTHARCGFSLPTLLVARVDGSGKRRGA